jgi:hypothetical protein
MKNYKLIESYEISRKAHCTTYQRECGTIVNCIEVSPINWLKKPYNTTAIDYIVESTKENQDLTKKYNGWLEQTPYGEEGAMVFMFKSFGTDDSLELAEKFIKAEMANLKQSNKKSWNI